MSIFRALSTSEQLSNYLREEILKGSLRGKMPGVKQFVRELGVNSDAVSDAISILEHQGLVVQRGARKSAMIVAPGESAATKTFRIQILLYDDGSRQKKYLVETLHELGHAGHSAEFSQKTLQDLRMDPLLVRKHVEATEADAWMVASASQPVLRWFAGQPLPVFALCGPLKAMNIAGALPIKSVLMDTIVRRLVELGHQRIVMLTREGARKPQPNKVAKAFLDALAANGITAGAYHLPDWGNTMEEFHLGLDQLFRLTPPTALICDHSALYVAAQTHLNRRGFCVPRDVSMLCMDMEPAFDWCESRIAQVSWDTRPLVKRAVRWAANVAAGKEDLRVEEIPARFVDGGSIGKAAA